MAKRKVAKPLNNQQRVTLTFLGMKWKAMDCCNVQSASLLALERRGLAVKRVAPFVARFMGQNPGQLAQQRYNSYPWEWRKVSRNEQF